METSVRKVKSRNKKAYHPGFVLFPHAIIDSGAFKELSNSARVVLLLLMRQKGKNVAQPSVKFPYKDARKYLNGSTFSKATDDLVKFGFIDLEVAKRLGSDIRQPNVYVFSDRWVTVTLPMADSIRCPKNRTMKDIKTGLYTPKLRTMG